jgi:hypothetical protein
MRIRPRQLWVARVIAMNANQGQPEEAETDEDEAIEDES